MIKIKKLHQKAIIPEYKTSGSAGFDLRIILDQSHYDLMPGEIKMFSTGLVFVIPEGHEVQIRSRSGMAMKGIVVVNSPGTVDSDYRAEIKILLINHSKDKFTIVSGDRVAQGILAKVEQAQFEIVKEIDQTERGEGGFGSTGIK